MGIAWLLVCQHKPPVTVTANPRIKEITFTSCSTSAEMARQGLWWCHLQDPQQARQGSPRALPIVGSTLGLGKWSGYRHHLGHLITWVDQHMEGFSFASAPENYFKRMPAFQRKSSHHQHYPTFSAAKISREVHFLRKCYIIDGELRFEGYWVLAVWQVHQTSVFRGKGNQLARCGCAGFQDGRIPSPVPSACRDKVLIQ